MFTDGKLLVIIVTLMVTVYIMGLFLWKYYDVFTKRDKLIIGYLSMIPMIGFFPYLLYDYPSSNSLFLGWFPFLLITAIIKQIRRHQSENGVGIYSYKDQMLFNILQILGIISASIVYYYSMKDHALFLILLPVAYIAFLLFGMVKLYRSQLIK